VERGREVVLGGEKKYAMPHNTLSQQKEKGMIASLLGKGEDSDEKNGPTAGKTGEKRGMEARSDQREFRPGKP